MKNMGNNMQPKTGIYKFREWRGLKDSAYDYAMWCKLWYKLIKWVAGHPVRNVKAIFRYRWMFTYLTVPSFFDRNCEGFRGAALRGGRNNFLVLTDVVIEYLDTILSADLNLHPGSKKAEELNKKIICMDELVPALITAGFPEAKTILYQMIPVYLPSLINQHSTTHYISESELHGLPADVCPLPSFEAGVAIDDDYPKIGNCFISCNMPCDGSIMTTAVQDRRHGLPTHPLNVPLRWLQDEVQEYAVAELMYDCGVMVKMEYSQDGSAAYSSLVAPAMAEHMYYSAAAREEYRLMFSDTQWLRMLQDEIDAGRPVIYGGSDDETGGHQFVCDGYDADGNIHINWGWGGWCNGYYPVCYIGDRDKNKVDAVFNKYDSAIFGLEKDENGSRAGTPALYLQSSGDYCGLKYVSGTEITLTPSPKVTPSSDSTIALTTIAIA